MRSIEISDDAYAGLVRKHGDVAAYFEMLGRAELKANQPTASGDPEATLRRFDQFNGMFGGASRVDVLEDRHLGAE